MCLAAPLERLDTRLSKPLNAACRMQGVVGCGDQAEMVHRLVEKVGNLESSLLECERVRRGLHNDLVALRGNIRVYARIRPTPRAPVAEATSGDSLRLTVDARPNDFFFDKCAPPLPLDHLVKPCASPAGLCPPRSFVAESLCDSHRLVVRCDCGGVQGHGAGHDAGGGVWRGCGRGAVRPRRLPRLPLLLRPDRQRQDAHDERAAGLCGAARHRPPCNHQDPRDGSAPAGRGVGVPPGGYVCGDLQRGAAGLAG